MNHSSEEKNKQAIQDFLCDLICEINNPEKTEMLVEVITTIQQPPEIPRHTHSPSVLVDHPATRKQDPTGWLTRRAARRFPAPGRTPFTNCARHSV